jgi:hypothetical protein
MWFVQMSFLGKGREAITYNLRNLGRTPIGPAFDRSLLQWTACGAAKTTASLWHWHIWLLSFSTCLRWLNIWKLHDDMPIFTNGFLHFCNFHRCCSNVDSNMSVPLHGLLSGTGAPCTQQYDHQWWATFLTSAAHRFYLNSPYVLVVLWKKVIGITC